jgi:hypothetical protein
MRRFVLPLAAAAMLLVGCQGKTHQSAEARATDTTPADVHQMPTGFRNFSEKCDGHGNRVYITSDGGDNGKWASGIAVLRDPTCPTGK